MNQEISSELIETLIEKSELEQCLALLEKQPMPERRKYLTLIKGVIKQLNDHRHSQDWNENLSRLNVAKCALFSMATLAELKKMGWQAIPDDNVIEHLARTFPHDWLDKWAQWLIDDNPRHYLTIRQLYLAGLCSKPEGDNYTLGLIISLNYRLNNGLALVDTLSNSSDILNDELWQLFVVEGIGEFSLAASDKYRAAEKTWSANLLILSEQNLVSRERLLSESLKALSRDFAQFRSGWFSRFHEALNPSIEERTTRAEAYLALLSSQIPPTVTFTLKALSAVNKAGVLPINSFLEKVSPALEARAKTTVKATLKLLKDIGNRHTEKSTEVARLAALALIHEAADIQIIALELIEKFGKKEDEQLIRSLEQNAEVVAASLKPRLESWLGINADASAMNVENEASGFDKADLKPYIAEDITPITTEEDLVEQFLLLLENNNDPIEIERLLNGLSRLGSSQPADFLTLISPLKKRAQQIIKRPSPIKTWSSINYVQYYLAVLALSYVNGTNEFPNNELELLHSGQDKTSTLLTAFCQRIKDIAHHLEQQYTGPLLSAPSHGRAFIYPQQLIARYQQLSASNVPMSILEQVLAILRLDIRGEQGLDINTDNDEFLAAVAFALGRTVNIGSTVALWIAAARVRNPAGNESELIDKFGELGPDAAECVRYSSQVIKHEGYSWYELKLKFSPALVQPVPLEHLTSLFLSDFSCGYEENLVQWCRTIRPGNLEAFFAEGAKVLDIDTSESQHQVQAYFEPLLEPDVPMQEMALLLIACGLGCSEIALRALASEIVIVGLNDRRLSIPELANTMAGLIDSGYIKVSRWTKALTDIAAASPRCALAMQSLIPLLLRHDPANAPRDLGGLLELLYELCIATKQRVNDEGALNYFKHNQKGGKQGKFSKKLLAL